jgi:hypothetical protein
MINRGDPLAHEIWEKLNTISENVTDLILEYGVPVPRIESWVDDAIETAEALSLANRLKDGT